MEYVSNQNIIRLSPIKVRPSRDDATLVAASQSPAAALRVSRGGAHGMAAYRRPSSRQSCSRTASGGLRSRHHLSSICLMCLFKIVLT